MADETLRGIKLEIVPDEPDEIRAFRARRAAEGIAEMKTLARAAEMGLVRRDPPEHGWDRKPEPPDIVA